ncbi:MAG: CoA transferase, partial [Tepidiformaceae bacterium]
MSGALSGVRVIEFGTGVGPAYCGRLLAGLGADVVKIEGPTGDRLRREGPFPGDVPDDEHSGLFLHLNTGKRSVDAEGTGALSKLLPGTDVLLLAHRPK